MITVEKFIEVCSIVSSRSFGNNDNQEFIPIVDFINGTPNSNHNCILELIYVTAAHTRILRTTQTIYAGEEVFLEYAQCGNDYFLVAHDCIPFDRDIIMNNQYNEITLNMVGYFAKESANIHPGTNSTKIREAKMTYITTVSGIPPTITVNDMIISKMNSIQSLRQVLIFFHTDEAAVRKKIETKSLKYDLNTELIFKSLLTLIENHFGRPNLEYYNSLVTHADDLTENMKSAIYLHMSERLVIETLLNRFLDLFDEFQYPCALEIFGAHLIAEDFSAVVTELERPYYVLRS